MRLKRKVTRQSKRVEVFTGDNSDVMSRFPENHFHSVVSDPPYGLSENGKNYSSQTIADMITTWAKGDDYDYSNRRGFLGKDWDGGVPQPSTWKQTFRVLRPGGFVVAFGHPKTVDLLILSLRLAGFEIRDQIMWIYTQGFPKAVDAGKQIDKHLGTLQTSGKYVNLQHDIRGGQAFSEVSNIGGRRMARSLEGQGGYGKTMVPAYEPNSPHAEEWHGWKSALKPAHEVIVVARKPLEGTTAQNILRWETGVMNIDACRVPLADGEKVKGSGHGGSLDTRNMGWGFKRVGRDPDLGRFPANVIGEFNDDLQRYFYCPKPGRTEKDFGVSDPSGKSAKNPHCTVKPVRLMEYLVRLVTKKDGLVLDPFCGSGTTGIAAQNEGMQFVGIEQDVKYADVARKRIGAWINHVQAA
ncbi:DNA-methyltransferase [Magnetovibrio blakemorei]|uniref:Methyltransferase n=1 Tax=Magnetovibrio blakemorei TaxID=28181 RepID=A0A1E5Q3X7_9PROT|nr:site-specific DNA-methyltransferase [Magnetovibrio blakemorei]OEJ64568.1 hypothetical protein BEN30_16195 [Magnetovibrio blakemorei]